MKPFFGLMLASLLLISCRSYENQSHYRVEVGELVKVYFSTNSCCYYCVIDQEKLQHVSFLDKITVDTGPRNCDGCNATYAYMLEAKSPGIDTFKIANQVASEPCDSITQFESYIIEVLEKGR